MGGLVLLSVFNVSSLVSMSINEKKICTALQNRLEKEHKINVLRNGNIHEISTSDLVVGDICIIKYGKY